MASGKLEIILNDDGTATINGRGLIGSEEELNKAMQKLAREVGGEFEVEQHKDQHHEHHHDHTRTGHRH